MLAVTINEQKFSDTLFCIRELSCVKQNSGVDQFPVEQFANCFAAECSKINN